MITDQHTENADYDDKQDLSHVVPENRPTMVYLLRKAKKIWEIVTW